MRKAITTELIRQLPVGPCDIWDTKLPGFVLRVRRNGGASYLASIARGAWHTIAPVERLTAHEAREQARSILGDASKARAQGHDPVALRKQQRARRPSLTLDKFLSTEFEPWALEHYKNEQRGREIVRRLRTVFADFLPLKLGDITQFAFEKWRTARLKGHGGKRPKAATVNSHLTMLKAVMAKAVAWDVLTVHPLEEVKELVTDKTGRVRFLLPEEEQRLRAALAARDAKRRARRVQANEWRQARDYALWPVDADDHLTTIVILELNTGLRKGEVFALRRSDVDLLAARLAVRGETAKNSQTRYVDLNTEAVDVLRKWLQQSAATAKPEDFVFPGRKPDEPLDDVKKGWLPIVKAAKLTNFRFHDLRHTFASNLVMANTDLNTVRELLGHADIKMTLRYAHLAKSHKAAAVAKLVSA